MLLTACELSAVSLTPSSVAAFKACSDVIIFFRRLFTTRSERGKGGWGCGGGG